MDYSEPRRRVAAVAERQRSLITASQLRDCGMSRTAIATDRRRGHLVPVFRGVDRVGGGSTSPRQLLDAALLALTEPAAAARASALALHGLVELPPVHAIVVPYGRSVRLVAADTDPEAIRYIRLHRSRSLTGEEVSVVDGTRSTDVVRALLEVRSEVTASRWRDLAAAAIRANLTNRTELLDRLDVLGNVRGSAHMRRELADLPDQLGRARSRPETDLPARFEGAGLPTPVLNHEVRDATGTLVAEIDAALPQWRLGYELDSRAWHTLPSQVMNDELKDLRLGALGWVVHRIPVAMLRQPRYLEQLLAQTFAAACARLATDPPA